MAEKESDMMYSNQFVASVKCGGRIMREQGETVLLPFGAEYSLLLKNLSTTRAQVGITIDGDDVLSGSRLCVNSNEDYELTRFIIDGNLKKGPRFKFIEKTSKISDVRGDCIDDGIIRVTYAFEVRRNPILRFDPTHDSHFYGDSNVRGGGDLSKSIYSSNVSGQSVTSEASSSVTLDSLSDVGITTKGSESVQQFQRVHMGPVGQESVIVLYLRGVNESGVEISQPVTVKTKMKCDMCGTINKSGGKFCSECGTNLNW